MRLLLDTDALLWLLQSPERLSATAREAILDDGNALLFSVASVWEIAIKRRLGKLEAPDDLPDRLAPLGVDLLPVTASAAWSVARLPMIHKDPFDRLLVAQALEEGLTLLTSDMVLVRYGVLVLSA